MPLKEPKTEEISALDIIDKIGDVHQQAKKFDLKVSALKLRILALLLEKKTGITQKELEKIIKENYKHPKE